MTSNTGQASAPPPVGSQLEYFYRSSEALEQRLRPLGSQWHLLGDAITNVVFQSIGLCVLTACTAVVVYIVISRKWKDASTFFLLSFVIPDWVSLVISWLRVISRSIQLWSILDSDMFIISGGLDAIAGCMLTQDCPAHPVWREGWPMYLEHECIGTALLVVDKLVQRAMLSGTVWWLTLRKESQSILPTALLLSVPIISTFVSASLHVQATCSANKVVLPDDERLRHAWASLSNPIHIDATTAKLNNLTRIVTGILYARLMWADRGVLIASVTTGLLSTIKDLLLIFVAPICFGTIWWTIYERLNGGRDISPLVYIIMTTIQAAVVPGARMYPGFALLFRRLEQAAAAASESSTGDISAASAEGHRVQQSLDAQTDLSKNTAVEKHVAPTV